MPNFRGNLFTNGGVNNSFAKSIYYFGDKFFVLTDNGQLFTSLDLIEWSYQSQTAYNIFLGDDLTTIYAVSSYMAFNSNAILQFDSSSAVLIKSQDMDVIGINSDGDTTIYGYLNLEGGTNLNHNSLSNIDGGTYHLTQTDYNEWTNRRLLKNAIYDVGSGNNGFDNAKLVFGMVNNAGFKEILMGRSHGTRNFGYIRALHNESSSSDNYIEIGQHGGQAMNLRGDRVAFFNNSGTGYSNLLIEQIRWGNNSGHRIGLNSSGNILHYVSGNLKAVIDTTIDTDRWADMRTRAYTAHDRTTAITYTPEVVNPPAPAYTTITGDLIVTGTINGQTISGSHTLTHITTSTDATLEEGIFVETTGEIHYEEPPTKYVKVVEIKTRPSVEPIEPATFDEDRNILTEAVYGVEEYEVTHEEPAQSDPLNPYENCICKVKRAMSLNKNIVGVLTSVNPVKFATHGDVLVKVISDTYQLGDILIPTIDGYGKKATSGEIYDSLFMMIPRAKITALHTNIPNTVSAILL